MNPGEILSWTHNRSPEAATAMDALLRAIDFERRGRLDDASHAAAEAAEAAKEYSDTLYQEAEEARRAEDAEEQRHRDSVRYQLQGGLA